MTYEMYRNVFMICAAAGAVMAFISVLLFVFLRIPSVIGDLTGITARRGIEQIRSGNGKKAKKNSADKANSRRGRLTAKISPSGRLQEQGSQGYGANTEELQALGAVDETTLLRSSIVDETMLLRSGMVNETTLLDSGMVDETTLLNAGMANGTAVPDMGFHVMEDITVLHTEEEIYKREE